MKTKTLLASGAMLLSMVAIGSAKTWDIVVDSATRAGAVTLPAGNYSVKLKNSEAVFKADSGKTYNVPVKVEQNNRKFDETTVQSTNQNGNQVMQEIRLGGTADKIEFGTGTE